MRRTVTSLRKPTSPDVGSRATSRGCRPCPTEERRSLNSDEPYGTSPLPGSAAPVVGGDALARPVAYRGGHSPDVARQRRSSISRWNRPNKKAVRAGGGPAGQPRLFPASALGQHAGKLRLEMLHLGHIEARFPHGQFRSQLVVEIRGVQTVDAGHGLGIGGAP